MEVDYRKRQYMLHFGTFVLLLLLLLSGTSIRFQILNSSKFVSIAACCLLLQYASL